MHQAYDLFGSHFFLTICIRKAYRGMPNKYNGHKSKKTLHISMSNLLGSLDTVRNDDQEIPIPKKNKKTKPETNDTANTKSQ